MADFRDINGGDDSGVVWHEYTHGLSNRLVVICRRRRGALLGASTALGRGVERLVRAPGGGWVLAYAGGKLTIGTLNKLIPSAGATNVRFVKLVLRTNRGNPSYMDMSELTVRGQ